MSQDIFSNINPDTTSGTDLSVSLNAFKDAVASGFSGTARPANLQKGGYWVDTSLESGQNLFRYYFYNGTSDTLIFTINKVTGRILFPTIDGGQVVKKVSADALPAILNLFKARAETGAPAQVLSGDVISQITSSSTDDTGAVITEVATIEAVATENHTGAAQGTILNFYTKFTGTAVKKIIASIAEGFIYLWGTTSGRVRVKAAAITTNHDLILPATQGAADTYLKNDGVGNLSWAAVASGGANTSLSNLVEILYNESGGLYGTQINTNLMFKQPANRLVPNTFIVQTNNDYYPVFGGYTGTHLKITSGNLIDSVGISGDLILGIGTASAGRGKLKIQIPSNGDGTTGVTGHVLTQTDAAGSVAWQAPAAAASWTKYTISHTALQAAALTNNAAVLTLPIKGIVEGILIKTTTAFAGAGITSYNLTVGITGNESKYLPTFDADAAVAGGNYAVSSIAVGGEDLGATEEIKVFATAIGANLDQSNAGSVDIYVKVATLP